MHKKIPHSEYRRRLLSQYRVDENGCWIWTGQVTVWGYGYFPMHAVGTAHRASYLLLKDDSPIPKGMRICHTCDVRLCINPDHLWLGTQQENIRDCASKKRHTNGAKTHCRHGHEYTPENTRYHDAGKGRLRRACILCGRIRQRIKSGWTEEEARAIPGPIPFSAETARRKWNHDKRPRA